MYYKFMLIWIQVRAYKFTLYSMSLANQLKPIMQINIQDVLRNYWLLGSSNALSKSLRMVAGIMSMLAILSPFFSLMATPPLVFRLSDRIWVQKVENNNNNLTN